MYNVKLHQTENISNIYILCRTFEPLHLLPLLDALHFSAAVIDNVPLLSLYASHEMAGGLTCGRYPYQGIPADLAMSALRMMTWISQQKDE